MERILALFVKRTQTLIEQICADEQSLSAQKLELINEWRKINESLSEHLQTMGKSVKATVTVRNPIDDKGKPYVMGIADNKIVFYPAEWSNICHGLTDSTVAEYNSGCPLSIEETDVKWLAAGIKKLPDLLKQAADTIKDLAYEKWTTLQQTKDAIIRAKSKPTTKLMEKIRLLAETRLW